MAQQFVLEILPSPAFPSLDIQNTIESLHYPQVDDDDDDDQIHPNVTSFEYFFDALASQNLLRSFGC